jgi:hypothetical protein
MWTMHEAVGQRDNGAVKKWYSQELRQKSGTEGENGDMDERNCRAVGSGTAGTVGYRDIVTAGRWNNT